MSDFMQTMRAMFRNRGMRIIIFGLWAGTGLIMGLVLSGHVEVAWAVSLVGTPLVLLTSLLDDLYRRRSRNERLEKL
jgi:hypothetical protein